MVQGTEMRSTLFVGLDVGTTTSKAVVFTEAGEAVATGRAVDVYGLRCRTRRQCPAHSR